jgi:hypothetical protein
MVNLAFPSSKKYGMNVVEQENMMLIWYLILIYLLGNVWDGDVKENGSHTTS